MKHAASQHVLKNRRNRTDRIFWERAGDELDNIGKGLITFTAFKYSTDALLDNFHFALGYIYSSKKIKCCTAKSDLYIMIHVFNL